MFIGPSCSSCCTPCKEYKFRVEWPQFGGFRPLAGCYNDNAQFGVQAVTIPEGMSAPVRVTISGQADDDLAVNGVSINNSICRRDGPVAKSFCLNANSFEIAAIDNYGWISSYDIKVCFSEDSSCNPLP